jgi:hypothetical protein
MNGIEAQTAVVNAGAGLWKQVRQWGIDNKQLKQKEIEILGVAAMIPNRIPSDRQSLVVLETLRRLREEGCPYGEDL